MITATVLLDSVCEANGVRLTTLSLRYHRFIHSEFMTHRVFSRNAASSRAIPIQKMIDQVRNDPMIPLKWGRNQPGMQAETEVEPEVQEMALNEWIRGSRSAIETATQLAYLGVHKQIVNRVLEPWLPITTIVTSTDWRNFFNLRLHSKAQPEMQALASAMHHCINESKPRVLKPGEWHIPLTNANEGNDDERLKLSVARCARVSYLHHDDSKVDPARDLKIYDTLLSNQHMSPFEHQARASVSLARCRNFRSWQQYRSIIELTQVDNEEANYDRSIQ